MRRREFIGLVGGAATWPLTTRAQASKNIPRLCFITFDPVTSRSTRFNPFFQGLADLGYVDGKTVTIDYLSADGDGERFPSLAAECLRRKADIIAVSTTPATQAAKKATPTTPIVMASRDCREHIRCSTRTCRAAMKRLPPRWLPFKTGPEQPSFLQNRNQFFGDRVIRDQFFGGQVLAKGVNFSLSIEDVWLRGDRN